MVPLMCFVLFLALAGHSSALYCVCKDGVGDQALQKAIDYACGAGADCTPILQNGVCYQPNTVKDHCNYAVNSYFQKKGQIQGSCDFSGAATPSQTPPTSASTCVYPSSPSNSGTGTTTTPTTTTPSGTPSTLTPTTPTTGITPGTGTGTGTGTTTGTTTGSPNMFGMSPTSSTGTGFNDSSKGVVHLRDSCMFLMSLVLTFWLVSRV
ncbi:PLASMODESMATA CALLOSE-BINDING PROTEIN 3 [Cajanus cajan]|uniref:Glucan endo-1,3-beta-glucosidase-like protein At1g69295 family n=1 Tax=Cajanus cajan TaxID=3821 RepID=A0A151TFC5_CAJCA|nr:PLASMODESMATA CALLOSE-BINDING PROTEIN 3 [Cajanus cajan]KYP65745.1 Glucan endo-1,3-beta-glucosidase-like protein At1g69295 family [Cajanus cajan]